MSEDFIEDDFNLTGLNAMVPFWKEAMEMVLDVEPGACISDRLTRMLTDKTAHCQTRTLPKSPMSRL